MLTAAYYMLRDGVEYRDLGADHYDRRETAPGLFPVSCVVSITSVAKSKSNMQREAS